MERFRVEHPEYVGVPMTYAGRLDPMADGLLVVLVGEECKKKDQYLGLDKEYVCEVLLGVETDTYDVLGLVPRNLGEVGKESRKNVGHFFGTDEISHVLKTFLGKHTQTYPPYSSKPVGGKPLFAHAREGTLGEIEMPTKEVEIYDVALVTTREITREKLLEEVVAKIAMVTGDFRQQEIIASWKKTLEQEDAQQKLTIATIRAEVSSGTYMRSIAHELGKKLGVPALAFLITRMRIGEFIADSVL
ncbi:MAG: tRNA pseudouridine synthase tRNA pseudouridine55 synthase [Candidatus Parcubacteria bacterium]|jgi:tRNA pseudouridine55 synthase